MRIAMALFSVLALGFAGVATAQEASNLATADAAAYLGKWTLSMEFQGTPVEMKLELKDVNGKIGAILESPRAPEPVKITDITKKDDGSLEFKYTVEFGGNPVNLTMSLAVASSLVGKLGDDGGLFTADLKGAPEGAAGAAATAEAKDQGQPIPTVPTKLDSAKAAGLLGTWDFSMKIQGNEVGMTLQLEDVSGKLGGLVQASFGGGEPTMIEDAAEIPGGVELSYEMSFGPQSARIKIELLKDGDAVKGKVGDTGGFFSSEFQGKKSDKVLVARAEAGGDGDGDGNRRRRRGGAGDEVTLRLEEGKKVRITFGNLAKDSEDFKRLEETKDGEIFKFVVHRATKIFTDVNLDFAGTVVKQGNAHPDYPGVYSVWLKRKGAGWSLVFNTDADIWGTQHDPAADVAEVPLEYSKATEEADKLDITLENGDLKYVWGPHVWVAKYTVAQ